MLPSLAKCYEIPPLLSKMTNQRIQSGQRLKREIRDGFLKQNENGESGSISSNRESSSGAIVYPLRPVSLAYGNQNWIAENF
jgi:hypothetical protein